MILTDITDTLPVGILSDSEFTPDCAGLAVKLTGYFTVGELKAILEDLIHVDTVYHRLARSGFPCAAAKAY